MKTKTFSLRTILTATTGRFLCKRKSSNDNGIGDLYELLRWMTNDDPCTHQLGRFADECVPWLLRWFPELGAMEELVKTEMARLKTKDPVYAEGFIEGVIERIGGGKQEYDVPRIPADDHVVKNPYDELVEIRGTDEGIVIINLDE